MPSGPIDLFLPITANKFLIILMLMVKGSPKRVGFICEMFHLQPNTEA